MRKSKRLNILNSLSIGSPCTTEDFPSISKPQGRGWYCSQCKRQVHDFTKLSAAQIADLIENSGGDLCASIERREDGSIITREEPRRGVLPGSFFLAGTALLASQALAEQTITPPQTQARTDSVDEHLGKPNPTPSLGQTVQASPTASPTPTLRPLPLRGKLMIKKKRAIDKIKLAL